MLVGTTLNVGAGVITVGATVFAALIRAALDFGSRCVNAGASIRAALNVGAGGVASMGADVGAVSFVALVTRYEGAGVAGGIIERFS